MNINTNKLSLSHCTIEIPQALDRNKTCLITVEAEIFDVGYPDNQDGTYNQIFKAKHNGKCEVAQGDTPIKGKDKGGEAKLTRAAIWHLQDAVEKMNISQEAFYSEVHTMIRRNLPAIYERYKQEIHL